MDELVKHTASYQIDQEILDARGINMKVEEVAGLPTCKYLEKVQALCLSEDDLAFLKGLRRRIKNRLASQNSRRRSMEHIRRLARELRAVRACRDDAVQERRSLLARRDHIRENCARLRRHLVKILRERSDPTEVPGEELERVNFVGSETDPSVTSAKNIINSKLLINSFKKRIEDSSYEEEMKEDSDAYAEELEKDIKIFECRIDKLVQQSVNHLFREKEKKTVCAKTIFITERSMKRSDSMEDLKFEMEDEVLNLSVKEGRRKSHGRKQSAPKRVACVYSDNNDGVLDLKIKREPQ